MAIRRGITELFEAIPDRIEVSGHEPTWRITGGSFDAVVGYAQEAFDGSVVIAREDRARWWPRITLTVTTDPVLAANAPPLESLSAPEPVQTAVQEPVQEEVFVPQPRTEEDVFDSFLEEAFTHQEQARGERLRIPAQRRRA